ncbi:autotransporter domain-containing protein [Bradyrhizobium guangzhouense]|uniref:autotransporter domain-containing protein n=1 Tax=Bradyrhizobium guangzhouense TaxID=1325095 RepID=UPI001009E5A7|nr:autotransporter domain-containing protein [Bradyrhizobium guangzhouense]
MRKRGGVRSTATRLRACVLAALAFALSPSPAAAQWLEAGPFTSTNTAQTPGGILNSNTLVYGMPSQGDPVFGASNVVLQSPTDPSTYWVATVSGGIWKTTTGGASWTATTDHQSTLSIGAITIDASDPTGKTMYAGSGYYSAGGVNFAPTTTLLKSTDGGATWQTWSTPSIQGKSLDSSGNATVDAVPPAIKNIIAMGQIILLGVGGQESRDEFGNFASGGLFRSTDGGRNFSQVTGFNSEVTSLISTTIGNQIVLIAAQDGQAYKPADQVMYSTDQGATWGVLLAQGTPILSTNSPNPDHLTFTGTNQNLNMKVAVGAGGSVFVAVVQTVGSKEQVGLFYTPSFTPGSVPTWYNLGEPKYKTPSGGCRTGCSLEDMQQGDLHFALVADPVHPGVAYVAGSGVVDPNISGLSTVINELATMVRVNYDPTSQVASYTPIVFPTVGGSPHSDTRSLVINSQGNLLTTDDGGVYVLTNPSSAAASWSAFGGSAAGGNPIRAIEAYRAVMDPLTGRIGYAAQDNGAGFSAPNATLSAPNVNAPGQSVIGGDGFSVAVNYKTANGISIMYATADDSRLARVFANQNLSGSNQPTMLDINVAGTPGKNYTNYEGGSFAIVTAVNKEDPSKLLFRGRRLYTWTDPGTALSGSIDVTDITGNGTIGNAASGADLFDANPWTEKIAYGTHNATDAILAGGTHNGFGVLYLRTQQQVNAGTVNVSYANNALLSYGGYNPINVLFDPASEHRFFATDASSVWATNDTGASFTTLTMPANFRNPAGLAYVANDDGTRINNIRALVVGGVTTDGAVGSVVASETPFAVNANWMNLGPSLPNAVVYDLNYYAGIDTMVAATYGRGVFILYDVTSYFSDATELWFGKANNDSAPEASRLTGSRALEKFGTGTLTLSGAPSYSGGTIIDAGVVAITTDANLGAAQGGVTFNGGMLQFNAPLTSARSVALNADGTFDAEADTTWSGAISGAGALNKIGPGTLALTGSNSYLGGTFILGGTLAVGFDRALGDPAGQIGIDAGTLKATASFSTARVVTFGTDGGTVDVGANTLTASGLWAAQGPVTKFGSGTLALEDMGVFQGVAVNAGTLQVDGAISGASLQIAAGATLIGTGQIAAPTTVAGTLSPGETGPGVLTFTAPLTLTSTAALRIAIDGTGTGGGPGTYSQIAVSGAALTLGGTLSPFFRGIGGGATNSFTPALGQQFLIATAGSVAGTFAAVDLSAAGLPSSLRMDTIYGSTYVDLVTTPSSFSTPPAGSVWNVNQQSVAAALDALRPQAGTVSSDSALQNAINALYLLPPSQLGSLLTGLSAQSEARGVANAFDTLDVFATALQDHLIGGPIGAGFNNLSLSVSGEGRNFYSAYNSIASPGSGPTSSVLQDARGEDARSAIEPNHWWSSVYYQNSITDSSAGITGGSANITGFIAGLEGEVKPGQLFGIAASFAHTDASGTDSGSGDHYIVAAYGRRTAGPLQAAAYGGLAVSTIALHHDFQTGSGIVNQTGGATSLLAGGSIAYTFHVRDFDVSPIAALSFTHLLFDGAVMTSPQGFALDVPRQWTDRLRFTLGPTVTRTITTDRGVKLTASVAAGFLYQTAPVTALDALVFTAPTLGQTAPAGGAGGFADVGVYASLTNRLTGFVRWHGEAREHARSNQLSGGLSVTF